MMVLSSHPKQEQIQDVVRVMLQQEKTTYSDLHTTRDITQRKLHLTPRNIHKRRLSSPSSSRRTDPWRSLMISWFWSVIDCFQLSPENVATAVYFLDYCDAKAGQQQQEGNTTITNGFNSTPTEYQLLSVTALQLAVKLHEYEIFPISQLVHFLGNNVQEDDIQQMERRMLQTLQWQLHPPTSYSFLGYYLELLPYCSSTSSSSSSILHSQLITKAHTLLRMVIGTSSYTQFPPSILAYAALLHAMEGIDDDQLLPMEEKRMFALRLQETAYLTSQSPGLVPAFAVLRSLMVPQQQHQQQQQVSSNSSGGSSSNTSNKEVISPSVSSDATPIASCSSNTAITPSSSPSPQEEDEEEEEDEQQPVIIVTSPTSTILDNYFVHIPTMGKEGYDGIEVIPDFSCYGSSSSEENDDEYCLDHNNNNKATTILSPRNVVVEEC